MCTVTGFSADSGQTHLAHQRVHNRRGYVYFSQSLEQGCISLSLRPSPCSTENWKHPSLGPRLPAALRCASRSQAGPCITGFSPWSPASLTPRGHSSYHSQTAPHSPLAQTPPGPQGQRPHTLPWPHQCPSSPDRTFITGPLQSEHLAVDCFTFVFLFLCILGSCVIRTICLFFCMPFVPVFSSAQY